MDQPGSSPGVSKDIPMTMTRRTAIGLLAGTIPALAFSTAALAAGTTVTVSLWDRGAASMDMMDQVKPMGMAMMGADMAMATMGITASATEIPAGEVTFQAVNESKDLIHEMVLAQVADAATTLPYLADEQKVDEDAAGHLGEVAELDPGQSGALTVTLKPGTYILYCNIPGHYIMGMWTLVTVTG
jgi:uncharacterized cupredoxin-like copper-binding protein